MSRISRNLRNVFALSVLGWALWLTPSVVKANGCSEYECPWYSGGSFSHCGYPGELLLLHDGTGFFCMECVTYDNGDGFFEYFEGCS